MENTQNLPDYIVYTDGGCAINPGGHGAYAAIIIHTDTGEIEEYTNGYKNTTNNRMEIMAVIEAFEHIKKGTSVELLDVKTYQKKYQINRICAERLLEFRKEKKPKFKDYMMLQTGGKDNWSAMYLNQMIRHVENEELIIHTIKKYLSDEKAVNAAMRWYMRGLPLKYCIRKVLVDQEVAQSCNQKRK